MPEILLTDRLSPESVTEVMEFGVTSVPLIGWESRTNLMRKFRGAGLHESGIADRTAHPRVKFKHNKIKEDSDPEIVSLASSLAKLINDSFGTPNQVGDERFFFNWYTLMDYPPGTYARPHLDDAVYRYFICVAVLSGRGRFMVYPDDIGDGIGNSHEVRGMPGDVIIMRAGMCHEVRDIVSRRRSVVFRSERRSVLQLANDWKGNRF